MWRMMPRLAIATLTATLSLTLAASPARAAATIETYGYSTLATIGGQNLYGQPITIGNESYGSTLTTPGSFVLASFTTSPLPATATLTYNNTPFEIDLFVGSRNSYYSYNNYYYPYYYGYSNYEYKILGQLNGSIDGAGNSTMYATVSSITGIGSTPPFPVADLKITIPQGIAAPSGSSYGNTILTAQVVIPDATVPEPTTIAMFATALVGLALRRRLHRQG